MKRLGFTLMKKLVFLSVGFIFVAGLFSPLALAQSQDMAVNANSVQVNKLGGITVSGTASCEALVADVTAYYGGTLPGDLTISINIDWTAYQPAGKNKMIQASFSSDYMTLCYNTYPVWHPACGDADNPCPWITSHYGSTSTPAYVFSSGGRFTPGPIYVEVTTGDMGYVFIDGVPQFPINDLFSVTGNSLRTVRAR